MPIRVIEPASQSRVRVIEPAKPAEAAKPSGYQKARSRLEQAISRPSWMPEPVFNLMREKALQGLAAAQGSGLSFADEAAGGLAAGSAALANALGSGSGISPRDAYSATRDVLNQELRQYTREKPVTSAAYTLAGGLAVGGPAAKVVQGAKGLVGTTVRSAAVGAGYGGVAGAGAAEEGERLEGAAKGAAIGGAVGGALPVVARAAQSGARAVDAATGFRLSGGPASAAAGRLREALQKDGVDETRIADAVDEFTRTGALPPTLTDVGGENTRALIRYAASRPGEARNAAQAYRDVTAESLPDAAIARARDLTPDDPRSTARILAEAQSAIDDASRVGQIEAGSGGAAVAGRLNAMYDDASAGVNRAYDMARNAADDARLPDGETFTLASRLREAVDPVATERSAASVFDEINALGQARGASMRDLQAARSRLVALQGSSDGATRAAATRAKSAIDDYLGEAVERGMIQGDEAGLWRQAIQQRRDMGRQFEAGDLIEDLTSREFRGGGRANAVAAEDASRLILGPGNLAQRPNLTRDLTRIRETLGPQSAEWEALRREALGRVLGRDAGSENFGRALEQFRTQNPQLASLIVTPDDLAQVGAARQAIAGAVGQRAGVGIGDAVLKAGPDDFAMSIQSLGPDELQAARVGARQAITDAMGQRANASGALNQIAFAPNARRNLEELFGPEEADRFIQAARLNLQKMKRADYIAPNTNSQTFSRAEDAAREGALFNFIRRPIQAALEKFAAGLTLTDTEAAALVRIGVMKPEQAMEALRRNPQIISPANTGRVAAATAGSLGAK